MKNLQYFFDIGLAAIRKQRVRAAVGIQTIHEHCVYRHPTGIKCVIGHALPDELYDPVMNEKAISVAELIGHEAVPEEKVNKLEEFFKDVSPPALSELQSLHDNYLANPGEPEEQIQEALTTWQDRMADFAYKHNLKFA